eukprot:symbB.v1.2.000019.t1/scaffold5.1/size591573/19
MVSSRVYYAKNPICAKSADDPRILRPRTLDGRTMMKQQLRLEELSAQGREWKKHPELKPKPKPEGHAMARAWMSFWNKARRNRTRSRPPRRKEMKNCKNKSP